jgi:hypothetical protein
MTLARALIVRLRVEPDAKLSATLDPKQCQALERGCVFMSCYRGVRIGDRIFTSFYQVETELLAYAAQLEARSHDAGGLATATGCYLHDRAALVLRVLHETETRRQRFWPEE